MKRVSYCSKPLVSVREAGALMIALLIIAGVTSTILSFAFTFIVYVQYGTVLARPTWPRERTRKVKVASWPGSKVVGSSM